MHRRTLLGIAVLATLIFAGATEAKEKKRLNRALDWPRVDLSAYERVFVEDCIVTDPEASDRKVQELVHTVPERFADFIGYSIDRELFPEVERRKPKKNEAGLLLRVELSQYKPGSETSRFLLAGTSPARLDLTVRLIDAASGTELQSFSEERNFNWGSFSNRSITLMEERAAIEIAAYLMLQKGVEPEAALARLRMPYEADGPPDVPHGTIYILRPQGAVGAASRFRVGVNDMTAGDSRRKTYHVIYVLPGDHEVWYGGDKKRKGKPVTVEAGKSYYFQAMGLKQMPEAKGVKKLDECRLIRTIDLTDN